MSDQLKALQDAFDELKGKLSGLEKIADIETAVADDQRELAKTSTEFREATDKLEASLDELPEKWRKDIKNYLKTLPDPEKEKETDIDEWRDMSKMDKAEFIKLGNDDSAPIIADEGTAFRKSFLHPADMMREKAITATSGVGATVQSALLWNKAIVGDPWVTSGAFQMAPTSPNFQTLEVSNVEFAASATTTAKSFDAPSGTLGTATERKCLTYACRILIPREQEMDVQGTLSHVEMMLRLAYGKLRGSLTTAAVDAGIKSGNSVATGTAKTALKASEAINKLLSLTTTGTIPDYWPMNPSFMLNAVDATNLFEQLIDKGGLAMNPANGLLKFASWDINVDTQANRSVAKDGGVPNKFGAWVMALIQAQRGRLVMDRYMASVPGAIALYATFRFVPVVVNPDAYAQIVVGA